MREDGSDLRAEADVPGQPSGLGWLPTAGCWSCRCATARSCAGSPTARWSIHADLGEHVTGHANDMVVDAQGRAYVGNFGFDLMGGAPMRPTALHRVDPDGRRHRGRRGPVVPQRQRDHPDDGVLIVDETFGNRVTAFDIAADGSLANRRMWASSARSHRPRPRRGARPSCASRATAACLDAEGGLWIADAIGDRLVRVRRGRRDHRRDQARHPGVRLRPRRRRRARPCTPAPRPTSTRRPARPPARRA